MTTSSVWAAAKGTFGRMGLLRNSGPTGSARTQKVTGRRQRLERIRRGVASAAKRHRTGGRELLPRVEAGWYGCWRWLLPARKPRQWPRERRHLEIRR